MRQKSSTPLHGVTRIRYGWIRWKEIKEDDSVKRTSPSFNVVNVWSITIGLLHTLMVGYPVINHFLTKYRRLSPNIEISFSFYNLLHGSPLLPTINFCKVDSAFHFTHIPHPCIVNHHLVPILSTQVKTLVLIAQVNNFYHLSYI